MGTRGPVGKKNLPGTLRLVDTENDGHKRIASAADRVSSRAPEIPDDLPGDLRGLWTTVVDELDHIGMLSRVDGMALHLALLHFQAATAAAGDLSAAGSTVTGAMGGPIKNPSSQVFKENTAAFTELAKQLGLTFAARVRIALPEEKSDDLSNPFSSVGGVG